MFSNALNYFVATGRIGFYFFGAQLLSGASYAGPSYPETIYRNNHNNTASPLPSFLAPFTSSINAHNNIVSEDIRSVYSNLLFSKDYALLQFFVLNAYLTVPANLFNSEISS